MGGSQVTTSAPSLVGCQFTDIAQLCVRRGIAWSVVQRPRRTLVGRSAEPCRGLVGIMLSYDPSSLLAAS